MLWRPSEGGGGGGGGGGVALPPAAGKAAPAAVRCGSALGEKQLHAPTCLCVLSPAPFFRGLRKWLCMLYRHSLTASTEPVEALVSSLLWEARMRGISRPDLGQIPARSRPDLGQIPARSRPDLGQVSARRPCAAGSQRPEVDQ